MARRPSLYGMVFAFCGAVAVGCTGGLPIVESGPATDIGSVDAGVMVDVNPPTDTTPPLDTTSPTDTGAPTDGVSLTDTVVAMDTTPAGCTSDSDCVSNELGRHACNVVTGTCVQCTPTDRLACTPGQYCAGGNVCTTGCGADADCAGDAGVMYCDPTRHVCVGCVGDGSCAAGSVCTAGACVPGCNSTHGCAAGDTCCGTACLHTQTDVSNCGGCGRACTVANGTPSCTAGVCTVASCGMGYGDCDGLASNGCETSLDANPMHCGTCPTVCAGAAEAMPACTRGTCGIACAPGYGNCDGDATNGCETDTRISVSNCGGCGAPCMAGPHATALCTAGSCTTPCDLGYADCDGIASNGCEVNINTDPTHCGTCPTVCTGGSNATAACTGGRCGITCGVGYADCDGLATTGCEAALGGTANCGMCGVMCSGATPVCSPSAGSYTCTTGCAAGQARCSGSCVDLTMDRNNCGACGAVCAPVPNAARTCAGSTCGMVCTTGFADCDGVASNGCEVDTQTDNHHCGDCGMVCAAGTACASGVCASLRSCADILALTPGSASGNYTIDPDGPGGRAPYTAWCDMNTDGGGWTVIFVPPSPTLSSTVIDYTINDGALMTESTQVLIAYRDAMMGVLSDWARWGLTANWRAQSPFRYQAQDETVSVVVSGAAPVTSTLRYGYANWPTLCTDPWVPSSNWARLCLTNTTAPYYTGWSIGAGNYCQNSMQTYYATACSAARRFTIAVR